MEVWRKASDGPGEARAAGAKNFFIGGEIVYCFLNPAPVFGWCFWVFLWVLKHSFPYVKS